MSETSNAASLEGANRRDNVEQVYLPVPEPGLVTIKVIPHAIDSTQAVSLVVTGVTPCRANCASHPPTDRTVCAKAPRRKNKG